MQALTPHRRIIERDEGADIARFGGYGGGHRGDRPVHGESDADGTGDASPRLVHLRDGGP